MANPKRQFFGALESMRGLAALLVVLCHMPPVLLFLTHHHFIKRGVLMVPFFFVLSGFVICHNYADAITDRAKLGKFVFLRFFRIYPVHFCFLAVWFCFEIARFIAAQHGVSAPATAPFRENSVQALIENLLLVQALGFTDHAATFNGPSWSISVEFYTYILFGVLVLFTRVRLASVSAGISAIALMLLWRGDTGNFFYLLSCLAGFFLGCLTWFAAPSVRITSAYAPAIALFTFFGFLASSLPDLMIYPLSAALILTLAGGNGLATKVLLLPPLLWLGRISYSLYLSHAAVVWVAGLVMSRLAGVSLSEHAGNRFASLSIGMEIVFYCVTLAAVLIVADLTYRLIEDPFRLWSRDRQRQPALVPVPAV